MLNDKEFKVIGNKASDQAEPSTANLGAGRTDMRILIELQVISMLLHQGLGIDDDLAQLRASAAASIT